MSTLKFEAAPLPAHPRTNTETPRKKRKRTPAQGAADDCFTCLNRKIQCDRRRPYCSQCLDGGQDCAGYKTQLTWGVGVASRGKLRGLSLPIAGATKTPGDPPDSVSKPRKRGTNIGQGTDASSAPLHASAPIATSPQTVRNGSVTQGIVTPQASTNLAPHHDSRPLRPLTTHSYPTSIVPQGGPARADSSSSRTYPTLSGASPISTAFPQSNNVFFAYDKNPHAHPPPYPSPSPTSQYFQIGPSPYQLPPTPTSHSYQRATESMTASHPVYYLPSQTAFAGQPDYINLNHNHTAYNPKSKISRTVPPNAKSADVEDDVEEIKRHFNNEGMLSDAVSITSSSFPVDGGLSFPLSGASGVGKTPRMQYLIQYYAEVIAPVIVAFDSPSNPLRNQILGLAARSEALQHAISALSASNIRQRKESGTQSTGKHPGARRSSYMHQSLTNDSWDEQQNVAPKDRKREESLHKYAAVRSLNQALSNPLMHKDNSVLATLLMLCLFHICDSGIARFQTQFAGVRKLLNLRGQNPDDSHGDTKWMTRIFTLFDSVAATVNDREGQIDGQYVDISAQADGEWPFETLTGLDSDLFRSMSRLGRLNILSQGQSVESNPALVSRPLSTMAFMNSQFQGDLGLFDGNGWMRIVSDDNLFNLKTATPTIQEQFWREWKEVRQDLQTWSFDINRFDGTDPSQPYLSPDQRVDMCHISESFRYSCLLYTERLANPKIPSTDPSIQEWVQKSLYHIKQVRADVYLLWPLFITGAECGEEQERNVIRERCLDIQKDSGFMNNSSCLTLLEKVWRGDSAADTRPGEQPREPSAFKFRDVMCAEGNEGEWIVV